MKNKYVMITLAVLVSFILGIVVGYYTPAKLMSTKSSSAEQPYNYSDSVTNRALDEPNFCNEAVVESNIRKYFSFYFPNIQTRRTQWQSRTLGTAPIM